jgi:type IV secretory pathway VirB10-like protein
MPIRALLVLLVFLNLGVAAWALLGPEPAPLAATTPAATRDVPELSLEPRVAQAEPQRPAEAASPVVDAEPPAAPDSVAKSPEAPPPPAAAAAASAAATPAPTCLRLGPYAEEAAARAALAAGRAQVLRGHVRQQAAREPAAYTVSLPPQADRDQALALAQRIKEAGFDDLLVVPTGDQVNAIALGRYRSLAAAERRQQALQDKGFAARISPVGEVAPAPWWLEVAVRDADASRALAGLAGAAQARALDCAAVR